MPKKWVAAVLAMVLLLSGCSMGDMDSQLRAPRPTGEQQAIQKALDSYLAKAGESVQYILKYPQDGDYLSAFVMEDIDGDEDEEAIAFYQFAGEGENTHINLLDKVNEEWTSIADAEGFSADISGVAFGDLNGDGSKELLAGWSVYNSRDRRLGIYSLTNKKITTMSDNEYYTKLVVEEFITEGRADILLFQVDAAQSTTTVRLKSWENKQLVERGSAAVDGYIRSFGKHHVGKLDDNLYGVYIDCYKDADTTITELIYWDDQKLCAPFYNAEENITTLTARQTAIPSMVGSDGRVQWPSCTRLPGYESTAVSDAMWLTKWMSWDHDAGKEKREFTSVVNMTDGYMLELPEEWLNGKTGPWKAALTAEYDQKLHRLELQTYVGGKPAKTILSVRVGSEEELEDAPGEQVELTDKAGNPLVYQVEYDESNGELDLEQIEFMLVPLE